MVVVGALLLASEAQASTVRVETIKGTSEDVGNDTHRLRVGSRPGERNRVIVVLAGHSATVSDAAGVRPGRRCRRSGARRTTVRCFLRVDKSDSVIEPLIALGDRNDYATIRGRHRTHAEPAGGVFDGGPGNDLLVGGSGSDNFTGGPGNDRMLGGASFDSFLEGPARSGADTIIGGREGHYVGDSVSYEKRSGPVRANMDGRRDDGEPGERDRLVGIERLTGGVGPDRLAGDRTANELSGNGGSDTLLGHGGHDTVSGDSGSDTLIGGSGYDRLRSAGYTGDPDTSTDVVRAVDGSPDYVECGGTANQDRILLDRFDYFPTATSGIFGDANCEQVSRSATAGLVFIASGGRVDVFRNGSTSVTVGCPGDGPPRCDGQVELIARGRILGKTTASLEKDRGAGEDAIESYQLSTRIRLRRGQLLPATVVVKTRDATGQPFELRTAVTLQLF